MARQQSIKKFQLSNVLSFDQMTRSMFLTILKGEGFDAAANSDRLWNKVSRTYWRGLDGATLTVREVKRAFKKLRAMGYVGVDVTNPNWIVLVAAGK